MANEKPEKELTEAEAKEREERLTAAGVKVTGVANSTVTLLKKQK